MRSHWACHVINCPTRAPPTHHHHYLNCDPQKHITILPLPSLRDVGVGNRHVTPSSALIDAPPCFFYSISLWHRSSLLWYMNGHLRLFSFPLYSLVSLFCTSAFHSSCWGIVFFCFLQLYAYYFVPRLICALSGYTNISAFHSSRWDSPWICAELSRVEEIHHTNPAGRGILDPCWGYRWSLWHLPEKLGTGHLHCCIEGWQEGHISKTWFLWLKNSKMWHYGTLWDSM